MNAAPRRRLPRLVRSLWFWGGFVVAFALIIRLELGVREPEINISVVGAGLDAAAATRVSDTDYRGFAQACWGPCDDLQVSLPVGGDASYRLCVESAGKRAPTCENVYVSSGLREHYRVGGPAKLIEDVSRTSGD